MKRTKIFLLIILLTVKVGQALATNDSMSVYPNPFSTTATIHFDIADNDTVTLTVLN